MALFRQHRPDVTLMDLQLGAMSGVEAIRAIRSETAAARIVVLTMYQGDEDIYRALEAGATTYLLKDTLSDDLIRDRPRGARRQDADPPRSRRRASPSARRGRR